MVDYSGFLSRVSNFAKLDFFSTLVLRIQMPVIITFLNTRDL